MASVDDFKLNTFSRTQLTLLMCTGILYAIYAWKHDY